MGYDAKFCKCLAATILDSKALVINVALTFCKNQCSKRNTHTRHDIENVCLQFCKAGILVRMCPTTAYALTRNPQAQMVILVVGIQHMLDYLRISAAAHVRNDIRILALFMEVVAVTVFKEVEVLVAMVGIPLDAFQTAKQQCLTQHVEILAQRIQQTDEVLTLIGFQSVVVCALLQTVVQNFIEACTHQLLSHQILQLLALVGFPFHREAALQRSRNLNVIVSIDSQDVLYNVTGALNIHTVSRHAQFQSFRCLLIDSHLQAGHDALYGFSRNVLTYQVVHILVRKVYVKV